MVKISKEEEVIQKALGTLPKFEVKVSRTISHESFARVYVTAASQKAAKERALQIIKCGVDDDTSQPVAWAVNATGTTSPTIISSVRNIPKDDYMIYRFRNKKEDAEKEEKIDPSSLGLPI